MTASRKQKQKRKVATSNGRARQPAKMTIVRAPAAQSSTMKPSHFVMTQNGATCRIRGHEFLAVCRKTAGNFLASVYDMNPATWTGSRLVNVARSYELYRFNRASLHYVSSTGSAALGSVGIGFETDPNEPIPATGNFFQRTLANHYSALGPVWAATTADYIRPSVETRWWHCSMEESDRRQTTQMMAFAVTNAAVDEIGFLTVTYDIEFMYPELEASIGQENFSQESVLTSNPAIGALGQLTGGFSNTANVRLIETINAAGTDLGGLRTGGSDFTLAPGQSLFWSFLEGVGFVAFRTIEAARIGTSPVLSIAGLAANVLLNRFSTRVISRSFIGY
nr:structural protein [Tolivirales sp.]